MRDILEKSDETDIAGDHPDADEILAWIGLTIEPIVLYDYPTPRVLAEHLAQC